MLIRLFYKKATNNAQFFLSPLSLFSNISVKNMNEEENTIKPLCNRGVLRRNWRRWRNDFEQLLAEKGIKIETERSSRLNHEFLKQIGGFGREIYYNEMYSNPNEVVDLKTLFEKFEEYCCPLPNLEYFRHQFFETKQENESFYKFVRSVEDKSKKCKFGSLTDSLVMSQILRGMKNTKVRQKLFYVQNLTLQIIENELSKRSKQSTSKTIFPKKAIKKVITKRKSTEASTSTAKPKNSKGMHVKYQYRFHSGDLPMMW